MIDNTMANGKKTRRRTMVDTETKKVATRTAVNIGSELRLHGRICSFCSISGTRRITLKQQEPHLIWRSYWTQVYVNKYK